MTEATKPYAAAIDILEAVQKAIIKLSETHEVEALTVVGVLHTLAVFQRGQTCQQWQMHTIEQQVQNAMFQAMPTDGSMQ